MSRTTTMMLSIGLAMSGLVVGCANPNARGPEAPALVDAPAPSASAEPDAEQELAAARELLAAARDGTLQGESPQALFDAAVVLADAPEHEAAIEAFQIFLARYGDRPDQAAHSVEAELRIGRAHAARGHREEAETHYRATVAAFASWGLPPATDAADPAAEAQFLLAEYALDQVLEHEELAGTDEELERKTKALFDALVVAASAYEAVLAYRRGEWDLAAMVRRGQAFETTATAVREAPVPAALPERSEAWRAYKDVVEGFAAQAEAKAIEQYTRAVVHGEELEIANDWTRTARARLDVYASRGRAAAMSEEASQ